MVKPRCFTSLHHSAWTIRTMYSFITPLSLAGLCHHHSVLLSTLFISSKRILSSPFRLGKDQISMNNEASLDKLFDFMRKWCELLMERTSENRATYSIKRTSEEWNEDADTSHLIQTGQRTMIKKISENFLYFCIWFIQLSYSIEEADIRYENSISLHGWIYHRRKGDGPVSVIRLFSRKMFEWSRGMGLVEVIMWP